jgi:hypothetical protein
LSLRTARLPRRPSREFSPGPGRVGASTASPGSDRSGLGPGWGLAWAPDCRLRRRRYVCWASVIQRRRSSRSSLCGAQKPVVSPRRAGGVAFLLAAGRGPETERSWPAGQAWRAPRFRHLPTGWTAGGDRWVVPGVKTPRNERSTARPLPGSAPARGPPTGPASAGGPRRIQAHRHGSGLRDRVGDSLRLRSHNKGLRPLRCAKFVLSAASSAFGSGRSHRPSAAVDAAARPPALSGWWRGRPVLGDIGRLRRPTSVIALR